MVARPTDGRSLPHSLEAERSVLGAIFLDESGAALREARQLLAAEDFQGERHGPIFSAMVRLADRGAPIDFVTVEEEIGEQTAYTASLVDGLPRPANVTEYAHAVKAKAAQRRLAALGDDLFRAAMEGSDVAEVVAAIEAAKNGVGTYDTSALDFLTVGDLAAKVAEAGPRRFLLRGIVPAGDYFVHGAPPKAQKSWNNVDLIVSVASGTPWLGHVPVDDAGPVLAFCGEGGEANLLRRIRAVASSRGIVADELPITVCSRAPHLNDPNHLAAMRAKAEEIEPRLISIDPLYLAARGASLSDLYEMGELLERLQHLAADVGASLGVIHHFNRKQGHGADRLMGAGPAEWARVLISATVLARHTDPATGGTDVLTQVEIIGGEIHDQTLRMRRRIWSDDPDDLDAPLHVEVEVTEGEAPSDQTDDLPPAAQKLLEAVQALGTSTSSALVDWIKDRHGHGLRRETVSRNLNDLERRGLVVSSQESTFEPKVWGLPGDPDFPCDITRDGHATGAPCDPCDPPYGRGHTRGSHTGAPSAGVTRSHEEIVFDDDEEESCEASP